MLDENHPEVTVVVPARNAAGTIGDTLAALSKQDYPASFDVIVVDDGSVDDTPTLAERAAVVTRVLHLSGAGPGRARNAGAEATKAGAIAFLDADCRPVESWLSAGVAALASSDLVVGRTMPRPDQTLGPFDRTLWVDRPSPLFESANLFVRRDLFEQLGGFESWLGPRGGKELGEDVWFGWRAMRAAARIAWCPQALVHHAVFPRSASGFAAERWRLRFFPPMAKRMPELRRAFFYSRIFLNVRSAKFDAAVAGITIAGCTRRPQLALATLPYLRLLASDWHQSDGTRRVIAGVLADTVGLVAMGWGSARSGTLLI